MNRNFDFRDNEIWNDREVQDSIGDKLAQFRNRVVGWSAAIIFAVLIVLGVWG